MNDCNPIFTGALTIHRNSVEKSEQLTLRTVSQSAITQDTATNCGGRARQRDSTLSKNAKKKKNTKKIICTYRKNKTHTHREREICRTEVETIRLHKQPKSPPVTYN